MQPEPNLEGAVAVDHRGQRFALGRTSDAYAVWPVSGGAPVRTFPQEERYWGTAWQTFQELEAGATIPAREAAPAVEPAEPAGPPGATKAPIALGQTGAPPEGLVVMDYQGTRYGVGRTRDAYAIWDLSRGGAPLETHPLTEDGWQVAWQRYQAHEEGAPGPAAEPGPAAAPPAEDAPAPEVEPSRGDEPRLEGAAAVDYRGAAYALGRTADGYAIWDTTTGGGPILTFPSTTDAWNQAWGAYQRLEGSGGG